MIGLPKLPSIPDRESIAKLLGEPTRSGGGNNITTGVIPEWSHFEFNGLTVRYQFENNIATHVTLMPTADIIKQGKLLDTQQGGSSE